MAVEAVGAIVVGVDVASRGSVATGAAACAEAAGRLAVGPSHATTAMASIANRTAVMRCLVGWAQGMGRILASRHRRRALWRASRCLPVLAIGLNDDAERSGAPFESVRCLSGMTQRRIAAPWAVRPESDACRASARPTHVPRPILVGDERERTRRRRGAFAGDRHAPPRPAAPHRPRRPRVVPSRRDRVPCRGPPARRGPAHRDDRGRRARPPLRRARRAGRAARCRVRPVRRGGGHRGRADDRLHTDDPDPRDRPREPARSRPSPAS